MPTCLMRSHVMEVIPTSLVTLLGLKTLVYRHLAEASEARPVNCA